MKLRPAADTDLPRILDIYNDAILNTTAVYEYQVFTMAVIEKWWADKQEHHFPVIVMDVDGEVTGFASYGSFRTRRAYKYTVEHSVYVHPGFRRMGYGKILLEAIVAEAEKNGVHVMVGGIDALNLPSIGLHLRAGFTETARMPQVAWKFGRWLDLVFVQKILRGPGVPTED